MKEDKKRNLSRRSWGITLFFCVFLGILGFHRFYVGKTGTAILMLITLGGLGIWTLIDLVTIIINSFTDIDGRYVKIDLG